MKNILFKLHIFPHDSQNNFQTNVFQREFIFLPPPHFALSPDELIDWYPGKLNMEIPNRQKTNIKEGIGFQVSLDI